MSNEITGPTSSQHTRAKKWFDASRKKGAQKPYAEIVNLTPAMAMEVLDHNPENRNISKYRTDNLRDAISCGAWEFNGASIVIASDGTLVDGQHRLTSFVAENKTMKVCLVWGAAPESKYTTDQGLAKAAAHLLQMSGDGENSPTKSAIAVKLMQWIDEQKIGRNYRKLPYEIHRFYDSAREQIEGAIDWVKSNGAASDLYGSLTAPALAYAILREIDQDDAEYFCAKVMVGDGLDKDSIILKARRKIESDKAYAIKNRMQYRLEQYMSTVFAAWNHYRKGEDPKKFYVPKTDFPIPK